MRMAETLDGSSCSDFRRLKVSRQEMPASTRMRALELSTTAVFPRLPLASTETQTPMLGSIHSLTVETGVTFRLSAPFERSTREFVPNADEKARRLRGAPALRRKRRRCRSGSRAQIPRFERGLPFD